jgi:hypothetical protein
MKLFATRQQPVTTQIETGAYDNVLPVALVDEVSILVTGYKEWSASLLLTDGLTVNVEYENGVVDVMLRRGTLPVGWKSEDEVLCTDPNGCRWSVAEIYEGLKIVAEGQGD